MRKKNICAILSLISSLNFMLSQVEHEKRLLTSGPELLPKFYT